MPRGPRVKRVREPAGSRIPESRMQGVSLESAWDEIRRLRAEVDRLKVNRVVPRFKAVNLDPAADGTFFYECGFQPYMIWVYHNIAASATVLTLGVGGAVADVEYDNHIYQASTAIRRSAGGQFRASSDTNLVLSLTTDDVTVDGHIIVESFDPSGFSYTVTGNANLDFVRGFAVGY